MRFHPQFKHLDFILRLTWPKDFLANIMYWISPYSIKLCWSYFCPSSITKLDLHLSYLLNLPFLLIVNCNVIWLHLRTCGISTANLKVPTICLRYFVSKLFFPVLRYHQPPFSPNAFMSEIHITQVRMYEWENDLAWI